MGMGKTMESNPGTYVQMLAVGENPNACVTDAVLVNSSWKCFLTC